jgi:biopolymer transport protein ExbD
MNTTGGKNGRGEPEGIFEVNMTPLIDVSLVLVVILMVAMPMAFQSSIAIRNAAAGGKSEASPVRTERIELTIVSEDSLLVNRSLVSRAELVPALGPILAVSASRQVLVRCAGDVSHGAFVGVLDDAKACGAAQIAVVGD